MQEFAVACGSATIRGTETGSGPAVVFVHAGVADRRSWFEVMTLVADAGMRCVAYDQRGYGDTESGDEPFSHRADLAAVLDDRAVDSGVLIGASRGGQIALDFMLASPSQVAALMLVGSAPGDAPCPPPDDAITELSRAVGAAEEDGDLIKVNELEARIWLDGPLTPEVQVGSPLRELFLDMNGRALAAAPSGEASPFAGTWDALPSSHACRTRNPSPMPRRTADSSPFLGQPDRPLPPDSCHTRRTACDERRRTLTYTALSNVAGARDGRRMEPLWTEAEAPCTAPT